jgi:hypothetical protein
MIAVAAMLPEEWLLKLVDCCWRAKTVAERSWAEPVIGSAMLLQKLDSARQIGMAKAAGLLCWRTLPWFVLPLRPPI